MSKNNEHKVSGHIGDEPKFYDFPNGDTKVSFSVATSNDYFDKKGGVWINKPPTWHKVSSTKKHIVETARNLIRGSKILVSGRVAEVTYKDQYEVEKKYREIYADTLLELVHRQKDAIVQNASAAPEGQWHNPTPKVEILPIPPASEEDNDGLPF